MNSLRSSTDVAKEITKQGNKLASKAYSGPRKGMSKHSVDEFKMTEEGSGSKIPDTIEMFKHLDEYAVHVGIPDEGNFTIRAENTKHNITNAELAYIHTHGITQKPVRQKVEEQVQKGFSQGEARQKVYQAWIAEHGSPFAVPPRPFLKPAIEANKVQIAQLLAESLSELIIGNEKEAIEGLELVGLDAQGSVQDWFEDPRNGWPPNAESTIEAKGSDAPLIDTAQLRSSITYVVETPDKLKLGAKIRFSSKVKRQKIRR